MLSCKSMLYVITLKGHKENFENNSKCPLINPAKNESGKLRKINLDEINSNLRQKTEFEPVEKYKTSN